MGSSSFSAIALAVGILVGLLIVVIVMKFINRDNNVKTEYDERQKVVRGRSYMYAFYGIVIANAIMLVVRTYDVEIIRMLGLNAFFIPILVGIVVQVSHAIFNDSYMGLNNNMNRFIIFMSLISIFNLVAGILSWAEEGFIQNGEVYPTFINLEVGIVFIIICIEMLIKKCIDKKAEA